MITSDLKSPLRDQRQMLTTFLEYRHTNGYVQICSSLSLLFGYKKTTFLPHSQQDWFDWLAVIYFLCVFSLAYWLLKQENIY